MSNTVQEIDESLELLKETKSNIRSAIEQKGVTVSDTDTFASYATKIEEISGGSGNGLRNLDEKQREQILFDGTYEGKLVEEGEVFTTYKGTFEKIHLLDHQVLNSNSIQEISFPTNPEYPSTGWMPLACVGGGKYVTAYFSDNGFVSGVSTDLKTWEWHLNENITGGEYRGCIYAKGVFIAGDTYQTGKLIYSTDGLVWTIAENVQSSQLNEAGVIFCHDKFYSIQTEGTSYYSEDGINWNTYTSTITGLNGGGMVYDGTNYVCATFNQVEYSSDGINWTASTLPTDGYCSSIAANETAIVIGNYNRYKIHYSTDHGVTWNTATLTNPPDYIGLYAAESNGVFLMGRGSDIEQSLLRSTDGVNWTNTDYLVPGDGLVGTTAGFIGKGFISEDGLTIKRFDTHFDVSHAMTFEDDKAVYSIAYGTITTMDKNGAELLELSYSKNETLKNYVEKLDADTEAVLLENGTFDNEIIENGSAFIDSKNRNCLLLKYENSLLHNPLFELDTAAYGNGIYITWPSNGLMSAIWHPAYSLDGITWYNCNITTNLAIKIIFDGTKFVALAHDPESGSKECTYSSTDGIHWTRHALISSDTYQWWNSLAYKNGVYVCANSSTHNESVAYTSDLDSWHTVSIGTTSSCYAYANSNVFVVAINNSTSYKYSTNGSSWSSGTLPGTYSSMQATSDYIYLKDSDGNNYYTSNGTSWNSFTPPVNGKIVKADNKYYCFSNYNTEIYESSNGLTDWTQVYSSTTSIYNSNICPAGNNKFLVGSYIIDLNKTNSYELYHTPVGGLDKYAGYDAAKTQVFINDKGNMTWGKAVQTIESGSANGTISVDGIDVAIKGLGTDAIQLGTGTNTSQRTLQVFDYPLLDGTTGKIPADRLAEIMIVSNTAPTTSTVGALGDLYKDTSTGTIYKCTAVDSSTPSYTWEEFGSGGETIDAYTKTETNALLASKQNTLAAGNGITIEDNVISATAVGSNLSALDDVTITDPTDGQVLTYNATGGVWENTTSTSLTNTATGQNSLTIGGTASSYNDSLNIGIGSSTYTYGVALGRAQVSASYAIQLGRGSNSDANTFKVGLSDTLNVELLSADGKIPAERMSVLSGGSAPTSTTVGVLGQIYIDTATNTPYVCKSVSDTYGWNKASSFAPSERQITWEPATSGTTYIAPGDGWVDVLVHTTGNAWLHVSNETSVIGDNSALLTSGFGFRKYIPVKKGDSVKITYSNAEIYHVYFRYAQGEI